MWRGHRRACLPALELADQFLVLLSSRFHQRLKNLSRPLIIVKRPLWMPLHSDHKVIGRGSLQAFNDSVVWTLGYDPQPIADYICGLVMTRVCWDHQMALRG